MLLGERGGGQAGVDRNVVVEEARCRWVDDLLGDRETAELAQARAQRCGNTRPPIGVPEQRTQADGLKLNLDKHTEAACVCVGEGGEREREKRGNEVKYERP